MNLSLSPLLVVVVVVVGTLTDAAPRSGYGAGSGPLGWPWVPGYLPSHYSSPSLFPSSADDYLGSYGDFPESSLRKGMIEDFNRRVMEVQRRCQDDFMILRRLLEEQGHPLRGSALDTPWYFPVFRFPYTPEPGMENEGEEDKKKRRTKPEVDVEEKDEEYSDDYPVDYEDNEEDLGVSSDTDDIESLFLNSPTPGPEWQIIPLLPEVPNADDLPDKYDNSTHQIHILNGSRVEVNTTTHKDSGDVVTTFFHTEVINILPDESEDDTTEEPLPEAEATVGDAGETEIPEESTIDAETSSEDPSLAVPAELKELFKEVNSRRKASSGSINNSISETRQAREVTENPLTQTTPTTGPKTQHLAAYVKGSNSKGKGKDSTARPRDLSGDTLVNNLPGGKKGGKEKDPDAEIISSEELDS